jgi:S-adenosylmethionine synthetase
MTGHRINLSTCSDAIGTVEIVERKGLGHPDTICDALAENLSRALCRYDLEHFGAVLHHNVDKALLCGGQARTRFGGGEVLVPIDIYLSGRAVTRVGDHEVPIGEIAAEAAHRWLAANLHALDAARHVRIHSLVRQGSADLLEVFGQAKSAQVACANDTSIGVGYAPLSPLEKAVLAIEAKLRARIVGGEAPAWGEDIKVMGARRDDLIDFTVACALIDAHIADMDAYLAQKREIGRVAAEAAAAHFPSGISVAVNAADTADAGSIYLTVTGTSAEAGDDGQVGRGNRANGLITPYRPMSLEALAGKNPVNHVGKLYNVAARAIAEALVAADTQIDHAQCMLLSTIGAPITEPAVIDVRLAARDGRPAEAFRSLVDDVAHDHLRRLPALLDLFAQGRIDIY